MTPALAKAPGPEVIVRPAQETGSHSQQFVAQVPVRYNPPVLGRKPPTEAILAFQDYLRGIAGDDYDILDRIIWCESGYKATVKNANSTASGIFQFLDSTWSKWGEGDKHNPYDNMRAGVRLYKAQGTRPWNASKDCWSRTTVEITVPTSPPLSVPLVGI